MATLLFDEPSPNEIDHYDSLLSAQLARHSLKVKVTSRSLHVREEGDHITPRRM